MPIYGTFFIFILFIFYTDIRLNKSLFTRYVRLIQTWTLDTYIGFNI